LVESLITEVVADVEPDTFDHHRVL